MRKAFVILACLLVLSACQQFNNEWVGEKIPVGKVLDAAVVPTARPTIRFAWKRLSPRLAMFY